MKNMNIFFLHKNPKKCAKYYVDQHVVKMILETAQLLCTAIWSCGGTAPYKSTHANHPCAVWTRQSKDNWNWLYSLAVALCEEYTYRYGKVHATQEIVQNLKVPDLPEKEFVNPPQCMPDCYKDENTIIAYRNYYIIGKIRLHCFKTRHAWKNREIPKFIVKALYTWN